MLIYSSNAFVICIGNQSNFVENSLVHNKNFSFFANCTFEK